MEEGFGKVWRRFLDAGSRESEDMGGGEGQKGDEEADGHDDGQSGEEGVLVMVGGEAHYEWGVKMGLMGRMGRAMGARLRESGENGKRKRGRGAGFHGVENRFPLCGKRGETGFHCVEKLAKQVSIVWKTH